MTACGRSNAIRQFIQRHQDHILGVLSGFNRMRFRGTLRLLTNVGGRPNNNDYRRRAEFVYPALTLAFTDANGNPMAPGIVSYHSCGKDNFAYRHDEAVNAVFLDGHVARAAEHRIPFGFEHRYEPFWSAKRRSALSAID